MKQNHIHTPSKSSGKVVDHIGRTFETLRLSLTQYCNFACNYCVGENADTSKELMETSKPLNQDPLDQETLYKILHHFKSIVPLKTLRLTGGEPLLYQGIEPLVENAYQLGFESVKLTSNAFLLGRKAQDLAKAGLKSINISMDAIEQAPFERITRRKGLSKVLEGIDAALQEGIQVKINCVIMKGINEDQILPMLHYAREKGIIVRFLELMKMGDYYEENAFTTRFFGEEDILKTIEQEKPVYPLPRPEHSTSNYWETLDGQTFGIIANESSPFCHDCNRLRLDIYGRIQGCLSEDQYVNVRELVDDPQKLQEALQQALGHKQEARFKGSKTSMIVMGG